MGNGKKKPTYKNFSLANQYSQQNPDGSLPQNPRPASAGDTIDYNRGFDYGMAKGPNKPSRGENQFFQKGRWEGQAFYNPPKPEDSSFKNKVAIKLAQFIGKGGRL